MESSRVYWKPIWNILNGQFDITLVNAQHFKSVPGRKTDFKDGEWLSDLLRHGLLRKSFVPDKPIRELRDLTRCRAMLAKERARLSCRIQKVLEDANIKLASVASDVLGASGRAMLKAIVKGESDPAVLADLAQKRLRAKLPELRLALTGCISDHHRFLLRQWLELLDTFEQKIAEFDQQIEEKVGPFQDAVTKWVTIPGIDRVAACCLVAEIGADMEQFPSARHLSSWAGMCPGNNESAGKHRSGKTRRGRRVASQGAVRGCVGGVPLQEVVFPRSVPATGGQARKEARTHRRRTQLAQRRLRASEGTPQLSGSRCRLLRASQPRQSHEVPR